MGVCASLRLSNGCGSLRGSHPKEPSPESSVNMTESRRPLLAVAKRRYLSLEPPYVHRRQAGVSGRSVWLTMNAYTDKD